MSQTLRLNNVIRAWEEGKPAFTSFAQAEIETAVAMSTSKFDGIVYEMEHNFWDARALRDCMQYMLNLRALVRQHEVVIKSIGERLKSIPGVAGATEIGEGEIVLVVDVASLIEAFGGRARDMRAKTGLTV